MATDENIFDDNEGKELFEPPRETLLDFSIHLKTRLKFPNTWAKLHENGVRIVDLRKDRYEEALDYVKNLYYDEEPLCQSLKIMDDEESFDALHEHTRSYIRDSQSLIAVKEDTNEIVGILISRVIDSLAMKTFVRMAIYKGKSFKTIQRFKNHFLKHVDLKKIYGTDVWNYIYLCSVVPDFRRLGIGDALFEAAIDQTRLFKVNVICGTFTNYPLQMLAEKKGFENLLEVQYLEWIENEEVVFKNTGENNYSAMFMGKRIIDQSETSDENLIKDDEEPIAVYDPINKSF